MTSTNGNIKKFNNSKDLLSEEQQDVLRNKGNKIEKLQTDINNLSKPLLQSEGSVNWSKHVTPGTLSVFQDEKSWSGINTIELKKSKVKEFHDAKGLSWSNMRDSMHLESEDESYSSEGSPTTTRLDVKDMDIFGAMPLEEDIVIVKCNNCQRPILPSKFKEHSEYCIGESQEEFYEEDEMDMKRDLKKKKKAALFEDELNTLTTTAKRPPSSAIEKLEKKKLKKDKQKKTTKQKAPIDFDKQCGVIQGPNNLPCSRSLTCKSHSMGAKRSVEGRSQPYDVLLAAYQKKSIGRPNGKEQIIKKKDIPSSVVDSDEMISGKSIKTFKKLQLSQSINGNFNHGSKSNLVSNEETFIDSDEEVENVMQALKLSRPSPLAQKSHFFVKRKRQCFRLRDILLDAITPKSATSTIDNTPSLPITDNSTQQQYYQNQPLHGNLSLPLSFNNNMNTKNNSIFSNHTVSPINSSFSVR